MYIERKGKREKRNVRMRVVKRKRKENHFKEIQLRTIKIFVYFAVPAYAYSHL